jgi:hypothetical protein
MKRAFAIFFLIIFSFNIAGYFFAYEVMRYHARKEIKKNIRETLPGAELTSIIIEQDQQSEIIWHRDAEEFSYKGQMYDLVRIELAEGKIIYKCINDRQEEKLFSALDEFVLQHILSDKPLKNSSSKKIAAKINSLYYPDHSKPSSAPASRSTFQLSAFHMFLFPDSPTLEMTSPPPRTLS